MFSRAVVKSLICCSARDRILLASCGSAWSDALEDTFEINQFPGGLFRPSQNDLEKFSNEPV